MRFWEILPGASVWATLLGLFYLSWAAPFFVAVFILIYDLFWVLKIIYLFVHLQFSFRKMRGNLKIDWLRRLRSEMAGKWEGIRHLIIFPMYREPLEVVRESFLALKSSNYPKENFLVVLATEAQGGAADAGVAERIKNEFEKDFGAFLVTSHPVGIPGELPGKGSNETWAAKRAEENIIVPRKISPESVLVSVFDIDSRTPADYFGVLACAYLSSSNRDRSSYQPIPLFTNNIHKVSIFARITAFSATFWQLMQQARPHRLVTFSSHSMPWTALKEIGFWQTDIVSEDSRIFYQCLNRHNGDWRTEPLFYPVYMDAVHGENFFGAMKNLYLQQRRWAWGVENLALFMRDATKNKLFPLKKKLSWFSAMFEGYHSWASSSWIIFFFGWLPIAINRANFDATVISYNLPRVVGTLMNVCVFGIVASALLSIMLLAPRPQGFRLRHYAIYFLQWFFVPVVTVLLGSLPALEAQTRLMLGGRFRLGFWKTPKK